MLDIIKRQNKLLLIIISMIFFSCSKAQKTPNKVNFTFKDSTTLRVKEFKIYRENNNGALFLCIPKDDYNVNLLSKPLEKAEFTIHDSIYHSTIIKILYSRKEINTQFYLTVSNRTEILIPTLIRGKPMFMIGWSNDEYIPESLQIDIPKDLRMNY